MQKVNFLPQVKLWNAAEFNARHIWSDPSLGEMTYDGSAYSNKFAVAVQGNSAPHWEYILTSQTANEYAATVLRLYQDANNYVDVSAGDTGVVTVYTESLYNDSSNKLATMLDVNTAAGSGLKGVKMDSSILSIDSSYVIMWSDPSSKYYDEGGPSGNKFNPLATIGTVETAITNALAGLGDLFELKGIATTEDGGTINGKTIPSGLIDFDDILNNLATQGGFSGMDKGSVIIFNNEEYVLLDETDPDSSSSWELLGSITPQTCVVSLGGQSGTLLVSNSFQMAGTGNKTLTLNPASSSVLGGVKTGHTEGEVDSSTKYEFALKLGDNGNNADKGYVSIPIITGVASDASYGIIANDTLQGLTHIYTVAINPTTCANIGTTYTDIRSIQMTHNIGSEDIIVSVYKVRAGNGDQREGRQLVYVDEIISGTNTLLVDFGSAEAFIGCQDKINQVYLGYIIVIAASTNGMTLTPSMQGNVDPDQQSE